MRMRIGAKTVSYTHLQANFNKTLEERRAAQKRYEESRENKDSGLKKYF